MDLENDPEFWKWLIEQQEGHKDHKDTFQPLVLELPLPPPEWRDREEEPLDERPKDEIDTYDDYIIFEM